MKINVNVPKKKKKKRRQRNDAAENADRIQEAIIRLTESGSKPTILNIAKWTGLSRKTVSKHLGEMDGHTIGKPQQRPAG